MITDLLTRNDSRYAYDYYELEDIRVTMSSSPRHYRNSMCRLSSCPLFAVFKDDACTGLHYNVRSVVIRNVAIIRLSMKILANFIQERCTRWIVYYVCHRNLMSRVKT